MFDNEKTLFENWLCQNSGFVKLEKIFSDITNKAGFFIDSTGVIEPDYPEPSVWVNLNKDYKVYIQYKSHNLDDIVALILHYFKCNGGKIVEINDNSFKVYKEATGQELNKKAFDFAYIVIRFQKIIKPKNCITVC
jgi:hypothetical protein